MLSSILILAFCILFVVELELLQSRGVIQINLIKVFSEVILLFIVILEFEFLPGILVKFMPNDLEFVSFILYIALLLLPLNLFVDIFVQKIKVK
jgi:hypothetical protein